MKRIIIKYYAIWLRISNINLNTGFQESFSKKKGRSNSRSSRVAEAESFIEKNGHQPKGIVDSALASA